MSVYVETSAAAKLLLEETESAALSEYLDDLVERGVPLVSSVLTETELRRLATRHALDQSDVSDLLDRFDLLEPDRAIFVEAGLLPGPHLRSLDALHIAVALRAESAAIIAYDLRRCAAAHSVGLRAVSPGADNSGDAGPGGEGPGGHPLTT